MPYLEEDFNGDDDILDLEEYDYGDDGETYEVLPEDEDEWEEPEEWEDPTEGETLAERRRRRYPRYRRRYAGRRRFRYRPRRFLPARGMRGVTVRTPAGSARINFRRPVATVSSVNARFKDLKADIGKNAKAIAKIDKTLDKNTSIVDKKVNAITADMRRSQQRMQQTMLLPLLLQKQAELEKITVKSTSEEAGGTVYEIDKTEYKKDDSALLPLVLLMGGMGGEGDSNTQMLLVLALSGALGGKSS